MSAQVLHRETCRLCDSENVKLVVKLEPIPLSENYCDDAESGRHAARYPVDLYMCNDCAHVQQLDVVDPKLLWENYTYYSGGAKGIPEHFRQVSAKIMATYRPASGSLVIDVGSNDGSLLRTFKELGCEVLGVDPAIEIARQATTSGIETLPELMSLGLAHRIRESRGQAQVVCMFNAFAHADNLAEVADAIRTLLAPDGIFVFEVQYLLDVIDGMLIATIFHEHISHHSVKPLTEFLDRHGMELIDVERAPIQLGSIIGTVQLKGAKRPINASVGMLLALETQRGLGRIDSLEQFAGGVAKLRQQTADLVGSLKLRDVPVAGYGAARSGPTLISQLGLTGVIDFIVDDHPQKINKFSSGDGIPILPTAELCKRMPSHTVILAWVHAAKIIETNREYLDKGGFFVVLCPEIRVVGKHGLIKAW